MKKEKFIEKIKSKYKDDLDFSLLDKDEYKVDYSTKIKFICKKHGKFENSVSNSLKLDHHKTGFLCPHCAKESYVRSTDEWIKMFKEKHGDKYDYSFVKHINGNTEKFPIICKKHNYVFYQDSAHHLSYINCCPKCKAECISKKQKYTIDEFLRKAKEIHGDRYDYSKVEYIDSTTKVCIICLEHGEFWQSPASHLQGQGCPKCAIIVNANKQRKSRETFLKEAREVHGDKYDYSKIKYIDAKTKIGIICPIHGEFWQTPDSHINGKAGCKACAMDALESNKPKTTEWFIKMAREVHGDKYDYSKSNYINYNSKIEIICPEHGVFWQEAGGHLQGQGCPLCNGGVLLTKEQFIEKAKLVHGNKYDYSKVEYVNGQTKVCIICPEHGEFWQTPNSHLSGSGCPSCGRINAGLNRRNTTSDFIEKAYEVHGYKYDYSKVKYETNDKEVCIICPIHGEFWQLPSVHLGGGGCQQCRESRLEREVGKKLIDNKIILERQKGFEWLRFKHPLKLDFYLPEYNVGIECQGRQHFEKIDWFGKEHFLMCLKRDIVKRKLCEKHGIKIFYYSNLGMKYPYKVYENFDNMMRDIKDYAYFKEINKIMCEINS